MSRSLAAVVFEDGHRLFLIYDHTMVFAHRRLFTTEAAAWEWLECGFPEFAEPEKASGSELPVVLITDMHHEGDESFQFETRASLDALWLTGPRNKEEVCEEHSS